MTQGYLVGMVYFNLKTSDNIAYSRLIRDSCRDLISKLYDDKTTINIPKVSDHGRKLNNSCTHLYHELFFGISGSCVFYYPGYEKTLEPGEILLLPRGVPHREKVLASGPDTFCNMLLMFMPGAATVHIARSSALDYRIPKPYFMEKLKTVSAPFYYSAIDAVLSMDRSQDNWRNTRNNILASIIMKVLNDIGSPTEVNIWDNVDDIPTNDPLKIEKVKKYITENIMTSDLSVGRIAGMVEYSPNYLSHLFKSSTGESLKTFINRKKMEAARTLLETTPYRIKEISFYLGYQDPSYFSKIFRLHYGMTPQEYQDKMVEIVD